jgi:Fe-S cluster assembly iron-binding protein IscA
MLALTEHAAVAIRNLVDSAELPDGGLRIESPNVNGAGPVYEALVAPEPGPADTVVEAGGVQLFLAPEAVERLEDKLLDVRVYPDKVLFTIAPRD